MRPGGGKQKGNRFELLTCKRLSWWVSSGERTDLFARNVLSGGAFTKRDKDGDEELAHAGDLMINHEAGAQFLSRFSVECKHKKTLQLEALLFDYEGSSFLRKTLRDTGRQAKKLAKHPLLIARQNARPVLLLTESAIGECLLGAVSFRFKNHVRYHSTHRGELFIFDFEHIIGCARYVDFIAGCDARGVWQKT